MRIVFATIFFIASCSSDTFSGLGGAKEDSDDSDNAEEVSSAATSDTRTSTDASNSVEEEELSETKTSIIPTDVTGAFLVACGRIEVEEDGTKKFGCGAFEQSTGKLIPSVTDFDVKVEFVSGETINPKLTVVDDPDWNIHFETTASQGDVESVEATAKINDEPPAIAENNYHFAFLTEAGYTVGTDTAGSFNSVGSANTRCAEAAEDAGFNNSNSSGWRAVLASSQSDVIQRLGIAGPIYNLDSGFSRRRIEISVSKRMSTPTKNSRIASSVAAGICRNPDCAV